MITLNENSEKIQTRYSILFTICQRHHVHGGDAPRNNFPKGNVIECYIIITGMAVKDAIHISTFQNRISINWEKIHGWKKVKIHSYSSTKHTIQM